MATVLMSNPGLPLAILGNPGGRTRKHHMIPRPVLTRLYKRRRFARRMIGRKFRGATGWTKILRAKAYRKKHTPKRGAFVKWSGRKGSIRYRGITVRKGVKGFRKASFTNPKRRRHGRRTHRRNPGGIAQLGREYVGGITGLPSALVAIGKSQNKVKAIGLVGIGTLASFVAGGFVATFANPLINKLPGASNWMANDIAKRIAAALINYTTGFALSKIIPAKYADLRAACLTGGAVAAAMGVVAPKVIPNLVAKIPGVSSLVASTPAVAGLYGANEALAGYFGSSDLMGLSGPYVDVNAYSGSGVGAYQDVNAGQMSGMNLLGYEDVNAGALSSKGVGMDLASMDLAGYQDVPGQPGVGAMESYLAG